MWQTLKNFFRPLIPKAVFKTAQPVWHGTIALLSNLYFGQPSKKMTVIGVTGTGGKTTTVNLLAFLLNKSGRKTGFSTTANYSDGDKIYVNKQGLSTPGGFLLQKQLRAMADNGCQYALIESTSEGLAQNRHLGINFAGALFTNLSPAHLDNHGGFDNYRAAKGRLFSAARQFIGVNLDDANADYFLNFPAAKKFGVSLHGKTNSMPTYQATEIAVTPHLSFTVNGVQFASPLFGEFNVYNTLLAVATADQLGVPLFESTKILPEFKVMAGRMEPVANNRGYSVYVDFACEPQPMRQALTAVQKLPHRKLIHVFGSTGGLRDTKKRFEFGDISARAADTIIITNDDVYDSDPEQIAANIQQGIDRVPANEKRVQEITKILDRRAAIHHALSIAQPEDIVLITGKSSEQFLVLPGNKRIDWEDKAIVAEELQKL